MKQLNQNEIENLLAKLNDWEQDSNSIVKEFVFKDFQEAVSFVVKVGFISEKLDHHPDILLHSWNKVKITISTHSVGALTENDFNLANKIEE